MVPTPADMLTADAELVGLINGVDGGDWAPSDQIRIGGAGLQLDANLKATAPISRSIIIAGVEYASNGFDPSNQQTVDPATGAVVPTFGASTIVWPLPKVHDGATLSTINLYFIVPLGKPSLPATNYPRVTVWRQNPAVGSNLLYSGGSQEYPAQPTLAAYINGGKPNVLSFTPDQNNVIDRSTYTYDMQVQDDDVTASGPHNRFLAIELVFTDINDYRIA